MVLCSANKQLARDHGHQKRLKPNCGMVVLLGWLRGPVVERWSLAGMLSLSCARPAADG